MLNFSKSLIIICALFLGVNPLFAQDKFTVNAKADMVSNYVWRGSDQNSGFSIQPSLAMSYKGLSLSAWGSQSLTNIANGPQEFDINLSYSIKGFTITLSDYWWDGLTSAYGNYTKSHHLEGSLSYSFKESCNLPLTLSWSTWFAGADNFKSNPNGDPTRAYSTYISACYDIALPAAITLTPSVGFTPWEGLYYSKATFTDIALKASKSIEITDRFAIPLFVQVIVAPHDTAKGVDKTYLVAGTSIGF